MIKIEKYIQENSWENPVKNIEIPYNIRRKYETHI